MIMIVSIPMVMNNHGTVCIEQTQVLNSKGIDPGSQQGSFTRRGAR